MTDKYYRYQEEANPVFDMDGDCIGRGSTRIRLHVFEASVATPCGTWLSHYGMEKYKWVSHTSMKRFAYPDLDQALIGFRARKRRQLKILEARIKPVKRALEIIENPQFKSKLTEYYHGKTLAPLPASMFGEF